MYVYKIWINFLGTLSELGIGAQFNPFEVGSIINGRKV